LARFIQEATCIPKIHLCFIPRWPFHPYRYL
jgi:hypothetical protein